MNFLELVFHALTLYIGLGAAQNEARSRGIERPVSQAATSFVDQYTSSHATQNVITVITPSPDALPVTITSQSQSITSYIPTLTECHLGGTPLPSASNTNNTASKAVDDANGPGPVLNCTTLYSTTITPICHATLHPIGSAAITVTDCAKSVTFSIDHALETDPNAPTALPTLMTTNYIANWAQLTVDGLPQGTITADICSSEGCTRHLEQGQAEPVKTSDLTTYTIQYEQNITGPAVIQWASETVAVSRGSTVLFNISETSILTHYYETETPAFSTVGINPPPTFTPPSTTLPTVTEPAAAATTATSTSTSTSFTTITITTG